MFLSAAFRTGDSNTVNCHIQQPMRLKTLQSQTNMSNFLQLQNVRFRRGAFQLEVSLEIQSGELFAIVGPSGSGKTTLQQIIVGLESANSGDIIVMGRSIMHLQPSERNIGLVPQDLALFPTMSARDNVRFPLEAKSFRGALGLVQCSILRQRSQQSWLGLLAHGVPLPRSSVDKSRSIDIEVERILEAVGLASHAHRKPSQLSGGEQQRVALARAFALRPDFICMDEPLSALDRGLRGQMQEEIKQLQRKFGTTLMYVTHDLAEAFAMSDRIGIMHSGRILQVGAPSELYRRPHCVEVAKLTGECNFFEPLERSNLGVENLYQTRQGVSVACSVSVSDFPEYRLAIRPEFLRILKHSDRPNAWNVRIESMQFLGSQLRFTLHTSSGARLTAITPPDSLTSSLRPGASVFVEHESCDVAMVKLKSSNI